MEVVVTKIDFFEFILTLANDENDFASGLKFPTLFGVFARRDLDADLSIVEKRRNGVHYFWQWGKQSVE